jgi:hypothetical protein
MTLTSRAKAAGADVRQLDLVGRELDQTLLVGFGRIVGSEKRHRIIMLANLV